MSLFTSNFKSNDLLRFVLRFAGFLLSLFFLAELFFRFVVVASEEPAYILDSQTCLPMFDRSYGETGQFTFGRFADFGANWQINNEGWISKFDYFPKVEEDSTKRIAIFGDSFVENFYVSLDDHLDALLDNQLGSNFDVYGFGRSGAYLYQYLVILEEIDDLFSPDIYVMMINRNDISSSVSNFGRPTKYYFQLCLTDSGYVEVPPAHFSRNPVRKFLRNSATLRYLRNNTRLDIFAEAQREQNNEEAIASIAAIQQDSIKMQQLRDAAEFMLTEISTKYESRKFIFVGDCLRYTIYDSNQSVGRYIDAQIIEEICDTLPNCYYCDLADYFEEDYLVNERRFEFDNNWHWNRYGNQVVINAIENSLRLNNLI